MGNVRGFDSYGQDMFYETKGGIWMPKETNIKAKPNAKALVPVGKRPPLPSMEQVLQRQFGKRQVIDLGYNYVDLTAEQPQLTARRGQKLLGFTPKANAEEFTKALTLAKKAPETTVPSALTIAPKANNVPSSAVFPSANAAEYGKMLAENPLPAKGQIVPFGGGATQKPAANETAPKSEKPASSQIQKENVAKPETTATQTEKAENKKATAKGNKRLSNAVINEKVDAYRKAMEKQGLKGQQLEDQVARYKEGLLAERRKHFNKVKGKVKGKNIAKDRAQGKLKVKPKKTGAFVKIGKFFKGKGGKIAAIAAGVAALAAGAYALLGGKDKKVEETPNIDNPELLIAAPPADETETPAPAEDDAATPVVPVNETPAEEVPAEPEFDTFKAIPGSWQWRFAERELLLEHQGEPDYKPTPAEINARSLEIVARDGRKMAEDNIHTDPMLKVGEDVTIAKPLADLYKEAKQQLIEEHKDQKGYEPTWKEMTRIVDAKIKEAKEFKEEKEAA